MERDIKYMAPGEGPVFHVLGGDVVTVKAVSADTGGSVAVFETLVPSQGGPPPHVHHREDEAFYIVEGEFEFRVGDREVRAITGSFLWAPRDIPHRFRNVGPATGKLLIVVRPAGFERFIEEFSRLPPDVPPDPKAMRAVAQKHVLEFVSD
jgi:quercetin dioxygenase-like cupin family protein